MTTYVDGYIFPRTIQGIESALLEAGYSVQIAFTNNQNSKERMILEDIIERDEIAGLIAETTKSGIPNPNLGLYEKIRKRHIPILFINSFYPGLDIPHVSINDYLAGRKVTEYMISMGHKKIGGIFKLDDGQGKQRYAGYVDAILDAGLEASGRRVLWIDTEDMKHWGALREKVTERFAECSAIFCYNDEVAFEMLDILKKSGRRIPEDVSIAGVDNSDLAVLGETPITSLPHPMEKLGEKAAENLLRLMRDPFFEATYEFEMEVIPRKSVKRINSL